MAKVSTVGEIWSQTLNIDYALIYKVQEFNKMIH